MARWRTRVALFVVERVALLGSRWGDSPTLYPNGADRDVSAVPVRGLTSRKKAQALRQELERQARQTTPIGPFLFGALPERLSDIAVAVQAAGLPPLDLSAVGAPVGPQRHAGYSSYGREYFEYVERTRVAVRAWWAAHAAAISPAANAALWDALFPQHRFYAVSRVRLED
jgi:hypothetical protein